MAKKKKTPKKTSNFAQEIKDRIPVLKFIGGFFVFTIVFYLISDLSSMILSIFGLSTQSTGSILSNGSFSVDVQEGCDAVVPTILFITAVLVFPTSWSHKLKGLLYGVPALFTINLIRIISLFLIGLYVPKLFDFMHVEFWQAAFILATVLIFISWLRKSNVAT